MVQLAQLCAKARAIVGCYKQSAKALVQLLKIQQRMLLDCLEVVHDIPTRCNSEHAMMTRLLYFRTPIMVRLTVCDTIENLNSTWVEATSISGRGLAASRSSHN